MDPRRAAVINVVIDGPLGGAAGHPMKIKEETNGGTSICRSPAWSRSS